MVFWADNTPWREANLWASQKTGVDSATVKSLMTHLLAYAKWLEHTETSWTHFPAEPEKRCLYMYRAFLLKEMRIRSVKPKTASSRMRAITQFYRWAKSRNLILPHSPMWADEQVSIHITNAFGFQRTMLKLSSDLRIPASARTSSYALEDQLLPVSPDVQEGIQSYALAHGTIELCHFLSLGFRTGMRLGTIADLKVQTLYKATQDPHMPGFMRLQIGPGAKPPVATKFGADGTIPIHRRDLDALIEYATCTRRLKRAIHASHMHRDLVFLTRFGKPYAGSSGGSEYRALEMEISRLRSRGREAGYAPIIDFKFHRTRATFGTNTARLFLKHLSVADSLALLKDLMLHVDISTTLKYVKFIQQTKVIADLADEYTTSYLKLSSEKHES